MADPRGIWRRTLTPAMAGLALIAPQPAAAALPEPSDLAAWLGRTTDLKSAQVAFVNDGAVYSLEPLGARLPTGEVVVLVRTEPLADDWVPSHGFASWDGNLLVDCPQRRLRVIRSASYPQRNRLGAPNPERQDYRQQAPLQHEPAAKLIAAACDADFAWPLRAPPPRTERLAVVSGSGAALTPATAKPQAAPAPQGWVLQVARGRSEDGAQRAAAAARKTLAPGSKTLMAWIESTSDEEPEHTGLLGGFPTYAAASTACQTLKQARQDCLVRAKASAPDAPLPNPSVATAAAAPVPAAAPAPAGELVHAVQVARGPLEDGARRALVKARRTLGPVAEPLRDAMPVSHVPGDHIRYEARLEGFASAEAAGEACRKLSAAGQDCFALQAPAAAPPAGQPAP